MYSRPHKLLSTVIKYSIACQLNDQMSQSNLPPPNASDDRSLLRLPQELRDMILKYALTSEHGLIVLLSTDASRIQIHARKNNKSRLPSSIGARQIQLIGF